MSLVWAALLVLTLIVCWGLTVFGIPGNWLMILAVAVYAYFMPSELRLSIGWPVVIALLVLAAVGELVEFLAGALGAAKVGGSKRGAILALLGSLVGGIVGVMIGVPIPIIGPIVAALLFAGIGALTGAILGESWKGRTFDESWQIGKAAFWGRLFGTLGKVSIGCVMVVVAVVALFF
jgi:hypothetical protein